MKEKMKGMSLRQKADYLWTYYKAWLLVLVIIAVVINIVYSSYQAGKENILVSVVVIGAGTDDTKEFESGLKRYMNKNNKNDKVTVQTNFVEQELTPDTITALATLAGAAAVDVLVCPKNVYEHFSRLRMFVDMYEFMGDDAGPYNDLVLCEKGDALIISDSGFIQKNFNIPYKEVYVAVLDHSKREEGKLTFVKYILENR